MPSKIIAIVAGPIASLIAGLVMANSGMPPAITLTLAITLLTAIWWVTEALPIPVTSIVPFVLFPATGVLTYQEASSGLGQHVILLLMGGFMMAKGVEKANLHHRISLSIIHKLGGRSGRHLLFGFMLSGALLSMWISNTATCLVLMPIALAVIHDLDEPALFLPMVLAVAFSCNLGGMATLIGTPPNLIFASIYQINTGNEFSFGQWITIGLPVVILGLPVMALWLSRKMPRLRHVELPDVGNWTTQEKRVVCVFAVIVALWIFRLEPFGGWSGLLPFSKIGDSTIALFGVVLMFLVPSGTQKGERLLDWDTASDIPWGMLLLFAGGLTIAKAFQVSGTAEWIGNSLSLLTSLPPYLLILCICLSVTFMTEITSNTATTTLLMPILAAAGASADLPIEMLMIPAAISASCAFMLPVATAPNAIAYGTGHVTIKQMAKEGFVLNLLMAAIISILCYLRFGT